MALIAGVDLPPQKRLWVGLTSIYGIGQERAKKLAEKAGVDHTKKIKDLTEDEVNHLRQEIEKEGRVEGDLRKEIQMNIRRLIEIRPIAESGIGAICRCADSVRTRTRARGKVRGAAQWRPRRRLPARRANNSACRGGACPARPKQRIPNRSKLKRSEQCQKNKKVRCRTQQQHQQNRQRLPSVRKSSRRSANGASCRTALFMWRRRSTTRRSPF